MFIKFIPIVPIALTAMVAKIVGAMPTGAIVPDAIEETATFMSRQQLSWWFAFVVVLGIISWSFMVKWLMTQLSEQREHSKGISHQLINFLHEDHAKTVGLQERSIETMGRVATILDRIETRFHDDSVLQADAVQRASQRDTRSHSQHKAGPRSFDKPP